MIKFKPNIICANCLKPIKSIIKKDCETWFFVGKDSIIVCSDACLKEYGAKNPS